MTGFTSAMTCSACGATYSIGFPHDCAKLKAGISEPTALPTHASQVESLQRALSDARAHLARLEPVVEAARRRDAEVVTALRLLGAAWRGDWSDFDGRTLRAQLEDIAEGIEGTRAAPFDSISFAVMVGICPLHACWEGRGYCPPDCEWANRHVDALPAHTAQKPEPHCCTCQPCEHPANHRRYCIPHLPPAHTEGGEGT